MASSLLRVGGGALSVLLVAGACNGTTMGDDDTDGVDGTGGIVDGTPWPDYGDTGGGPTTGGNSGDYGPDWDWDLSIGGKEAGGAPGVAGVAADQEAWLANMGTQCEPSAAVAKSIQDEVPVACEFFELKFPGVFEYSTLDPATKAYDFHIRDLEASYAGCDAEGSACEGRVAYAWSAEYLSENEWLVTISPKHSGCDYYNVILGQADDVTMPYSVVTWRKFQIVAHTQPTAEGLKIGAITTLSGTTPTRYSYVSVVGQLTTPLANAIIGHLKAQEWQCTH